MDIDDSMACGLIVNELMTNALKHAFPWDRKGVIQISLSEDASGDRVLAVSDDGVGIGAFDPAGSKTMGVSLVRSLARQLRGRIEVRGEGGTDVRIAFPRSFSKARS
jgi:two-component sensor histidine kinase